MIEVVLTREDANTEVAVLIEWLVEDRSEVVSGQPVCVVETTKATVEVEAPGAGVLVQLRAAGSEVELGRELALIAENADELGRVEEAPGAAWRQPPPAEPPRATRKAVELAEQHGLDLGSIEKQGFITLADVEELLSATAASPVEAGGTLLSGIDLERVTLPAGWSPSGQGVVDRDFLAELDRDPDAVRLLGSEERCEAYRRAGALIGEGVVLEAGALLRAPAIVLEDGVRIGARATVECAEALAVGSLSHFGADLEVRCRRAVFGQNVHAGRSIRVGGGGHRDPWAVLAVGDLTFVGDEVFVNTSRPVVIGREVFLTQRSMIVTHNIGHSVLEGFENRFAPVVLEDMAQVGLATVVYAGCRIGARAIVGSNSYVVADVPEGAFAVGVPARVSGRAQVDLSRRRQVELAHRMVEDFAELLALRGHDVESVEDGPLRGLSVVVDDQPALVAFVERLDAGFRVPDGFGPVVVMTLELAAEPPAGVAVLDLLGHTLSGEGGVVLDAARELCRKRGIRFEPGPWRYGGGLI